MEFEEAMAARVEAQQRAAARRKREDVVVEVARRYRFRGHHHVPDLPSPWCEPHSHDYTVEVVARVQTDARVVVDTDRIDDAWGCIRDAITAPGPFDPRVGRSYDLDAAYGPQWTTVEALSQRWLGELYDVVPEVYRVVVWEDDERWGSATLVS